MSKELDSLRGVSVQYGARETGRAIGKLQSGGGRVRQAFDITGQLLNDGIHGVVKIPAGALVESAYVEVDEVFVLGGTTPTILVGTEGSEVTNGCVISEAQAEAASTYDISGTLTGTWAAGLAADTEVSVALGGTSPTASATAGKARVVVEYVYA
jgi:hypothetical protein